MLITTSFTHLSILLAIVAAVIVGIVFLVRYIRHSSHDRMAAEVRRQLDESGHSPE
jgi:hypothetical protein